MGKIAWGRVIGGGILAAFVWWVLEFVVHGVVLAAEWDAAMMALGKTPEQMQAGVAAFMVYITLWCVVAGILGVWIYAAIRPRFGAGPKTAVKAGIALWAGVYLTAALFHLGLDLWPANLTWLSLATSFVESILATVVGAWVYKEA
jgi:hypothetical protein